MWYIPALQYIPDEIKDYAQWVVWNKQSDVLSWKDYRRGYTLYHPRTGEPANVYDPLTWGTYEEACEASGGYEGIGFVFTKYDPFVGISINHCRNESVLTKEVNTLMRQVVSYTEFSPHEKSIHIIGKGKVKDCPEIDGYWCRGNIAVNSWDRFLPFKGNTILQVPIRNVQPLLDCLAQTYKIEHGKPENAFEELVFQVIWKNQRYYLW